MAYRTHRGNRASIPKRSKTIPLKGNPDRGDGIDDGKYFRCWHCGFTCDIDRDTLGGPESEDGVVYEDYSPNPLTGTCSLGGSVEHFHITLKNGPDGNPLPTVGSFRYSSSSTGCPQCHGLNWKGEY